MSDQPGTENFDDDLGSVSLDDSVDAGEGQPDLLDASEGDNLPVTPPDQQSRATEWGTTSAEQAQDETIDQRIAQEEADPDSAYGAPDNESGLDERADGGDTVGGDDPDAIPASDDFLGEPGVEVDVDGSTLTTPDEGVRPDEEATLVGDDGEDREGDGAVGSSPAGSSPAGSPRAGSADTETAEESAMRVVEE